MLVVAVIAARHTRSMVVRQLLIAVVAARTIKYTVASARKFAAVPTQASLRWCFLLFHYNSLGELPPGDALANRLCVHVINRLPRPLRFTVGVLADAGEALRERVLVDVVLVVELRHWEAANSLTW